MEMNGFKDYVETGVMTEHFISDYTFLCKKIYNKWVLPVPEDEFVDACLEKLCRKIHHFSTDNGTIVNFLYNVIQWEARRIYQKYKRESPVDISEVSNPSYVGSSMSQVVDLNLDALLEVDIKDFCSIAKSLGLDVDAEQLAYKYSIGSSEPTVKVFTWWRCRGCKD